MSNPEAQNCWYKPETQWSLMALGIVQIVVGILILLFTSIVVGVIILVVGIIWIVEASVLLCKMDKKCCAACECCDC